MIKNQKVIIVTGANKGIGFALVDQLLTHPLNPKVILTARNQIYGENAKKKLIEKHPSQKEKLYFHQLDITDRKSIENFSKWLEENFGTFDILVNNAGVAYQSDLAYKAPTEEIVRVTMGTNFYGTVEVTEYLLPLLAKDGKIIMVSSDNGELHHQGREVQKFLSNPNLTREQLFAKAKELEELGIQNKHRNHGYCPAFYNNSKAFLNAYVRWILVKMLKDDQTCFTLNPGWCVTDLSGHQGYKTADEGTVSTLYLIGLDLKQSKEYNGKFFDEDGNVISF